MNFPSNNRKTMIVAVFVVLTFVGLTIWQFGGGGGQKLGDLATSTDMKTAASTTDDQNTPPAYEKQFSTQSSQNGLNRFVSEAYNFTFQHPQNFSVSAFDDRGGHVVLVQKQGGDAAVQMFITSWDEPTNAVTPERIKQDLPDLTMRNPEKMSMAGEGDALTFVGESDQFGTTREVWFARRGHLYQIITPVGGQEFLASLLETWNFK